MLPLSYPICNRKKVRVTSANLAARDKRQMLLRIIPCNPFHPFGHPNTPYVCVHAWRPYHLSICDRDAHRRCAFVAAGSVGWCVGRRILSHARERDVFRPIPSVAYHHVLNIPHRPRPTAGPATTTGGRRQTDSDNRSCAERSCSYFDKGMFISPRMIPNDPEPDTFPHPRAVHGTHSPASHISCRRGKNHRFPPKMSVFNPKILDASLRDVAANLSDEQKADVLLYAMERLQIDRSVVC